MNPPALLTSAPWTPGQTDARDACGRQDAIPKGVADDFARALAERDDIIARLRLALAAERRTAAMRRVVIGMLLMELSRD